MPTNSIAVPLRQAVTDGLQALFQSLDEFSGVTTPEREVEVSYTFRFGSNVARQVYTGKATANTPAAGLKTGRIHRAETGKFGLTIRCQLPGEDAEAADKEAFAIFSAIEDWFAVRKNNELDVDGLQTLFIGSWASDYRGGVDSGGASLLTCQIHWTARLT